jgi:hypothetical protein
MKSIWNQDAEETDWEKTTTSLHKRASRIFAKIKLSGTFAWRSERKPIPMTGKRSKG